MCAARSTMSHLHELDVDELTFTQDNSCILSMHLIVQFAKALACMSLIS